MFKPTTPLPANRQCSEARKIRGLVRALLRWFAQNARNLPWRRTLDPYAIWVSEIMLQQTQVKTVLPYWRRWMRELPTVRSLAKAAPDKVLKLWEGLGYYTRARNLHKAAGVIVRRHRGHFPAAFADLLSLPGVGRYTAGAIVSIAFNQPAPILDGNVIRVLTRVFGLAGNPRESAVNQHLWRLADALVSASAKPAWSVSDFQFSIPQLQASGSCSALNQSLMELGALVCTPRQPRCGLCPIRRHCAAHQQDLTDQLPNLGPRSRQSTRRFAAFLVQFNGRWLVRRRPDGVINAGLWEFPGAEITQPADEVEALARRVLGFAPKSIEPLGTIRHSITRYQIESRAYRATPVRPLRRTPAATRWLTPEQVEALAFTGAHRKLWKLLQKPATPLVERPDWQ